MIYTLSITSWASRGINATHYYGRIRDEKNYVVADMEHEVDPKDPRYDDFTLWRKYTKETKEITFRFCTRDEVKEAARQWFEKNKKKGDKLVS
jgi:hypothetical protein